MNRWVRLVAIPLAVVAALSGCGTPSSDGPGPGHTPAYNAGFNDGCQSGRASQNSVAGFYSKDTKRFESDSQYAEGWTAGFQKCAYAEQQASAFGGGGH